jgi:hypothetical protein
MKIIKGLSLKLDSLFFRNLTLILASIFIWRGVWNFSDKYIFPDNFILSNLLCIFIGIFLLFIFDSEVEEELDAEKRKAQRKQKLDFERKKYF